MKKLYILAIVAVAALGILATALATTHALKVTAANRVVSPRSVAATKSAQQASPANSADDDDDDVSKVIRFANNPEPMPPFLVSDVEGQHPFYGRVARQSGDCQFLGHVVPAVP